MTWLLLRGCASSEDTQQGKNPNSCQERGAAASEMQNVSVGRASSDSRGNHSKLH